MLYFLKSTPSSGTSLALGSRFRVEGLEIEQGPKQIEIRTQTQLNKGPSKPHPVDGIVDGIVSRNQHSIGSNTSDIKPGLIPFSHVPPAIPSVHGPIRR